jgi:putative DNA primase/helicase
MIIANTPESINEQQGYIGINPDFDLSVFNEDAKEFEKQFDPVKHSELLDKLLQEVERVDFRELAQLNEESQTLSKKHLIVLAIEQILKLADQKNWGLCKNLSFIYLYNGAYWHLIEEAAFQNFLGEAALKMGIDKFDAKHFQFKEQLFKQFLSEAYLPKPEPPEETVLINLKNGTFEITPKSQQLRDPNRNDFITYQLPFEYDPKATAQLFTDYLNKVLPDIERQNILAEYLAYLFIKPSTLKLEKVLLLYGTGANGKSVFFEIVNALLGSDNVSSYSLQSLTNDNGYYRAMLANKLVNYASELNGKQENSVFKQMASGEPVEARLPYRDPITLTNYAKLIFNCNELPKDVEQTNAYFRRWLIVPFDQTIPEHEQDKELSKKIIKCELPGVLNWVLDGLNRLLNQKKFTHSEAVELQLKEYKKKSDSVQMFLEDEGYERSTSTHKEGKELYRLYKEYCIESNYRAVSNRNFYDRLRNAGFETERKNFGFVVYAQKNICF